MIATCIRTLVDLPGGVEVSAIAHGEGEDDDAGDAGDVGDDGDDDDAGDGHQYAADDDHHLSWQ